MEPNDVINSRYKLIKPIGSGSFGQVWLAEDIELGIQLAVKIYIALDSKGLDEFKTEFKTTRTLNHPHLLRADHYDIAGNHPYLVMNYCPDSLGNYMGNLDEQNMWKFIAEVASGLSYLHEMNIVHRDVKPDNVLINEQGEYVVSDFGLSKKMRSTLRRASARNVNEKNDSSGTLGYMAPEMFSARPEAVKASDIWALGATIYEVATGELPFLGQGGVMELGGAEIPNLPDNYSPELNDLMRRCLARNPEDRPTAEEVLQIASKHAKNASHAVMGSGTATTAEPAAQPPVMPPLPPLPGASADKNFNADGTIYKFEADGTLLDGPELPPTPLSPEPPADYNPGNNDDYPANNDDAVPTTQTVIVKKSGPYKLLFFIITPLLLVFSIFMTIAFIGVSDDNDYNRDRSYEFASTLSTISDVVNNDVTYETFNNWTSTNHSPSSSSSETYTTLVNADDVFSFDYDCDCENSFDKLCVYVKMDYGTEELVKTITGNSSGTFTYTAPHSGQLTVRCVYSKDGTVDKGRDNVRLTNVMLTHSRIGAVKRALNACPYYF